MGVVVPLTRLTEGLGPSGKNGVAGQTPHRSVGGQPRRQSVTGAGLPRFLNRLRLTLQGATFLRNSSQVRVPLAHSQGRCIGRTVRLRHAHWAPFTTSDVRDSEDF